MYLAEHAGDLFPGSSFAVAHCNFHLRGEASDGDEAFVRDWCRAHGMPLYAEGFDTRAFAEAHGISLEMAARELRYRWFARLCATKGWDAVAVAHNADDDAETMILNLLRSSGSRGLRGMAAAGPIPYGDGPAQLLRPLLGLERKDILAWMRTHGKSWREDQTNADTEIKRNKLRHKVFPLFEEINPAFRTALRRSREQVAQADAIADGYFRQAQTRLQEADGRVDVQRLVADPHWKYLLYRLTAGPGMDADHLARLTEALEQDPAGPTRHYGDWTLSRGWLIPPGTSASRTTLERVPRASLTSLIPPPGTLYLDAGLLPEPQLRPWENGDWMVPFGMGGRKKLSDLFTDLKWDAARKEGAMVIAYPGETAPDGSGTGKRVAALVGARIDDSLKVTEKTRQVWIVRMV